MELLDKHNAPKIIDYLSIDTEGSEWEILKTFDFKKYKFLTITVEHNYGKAMDWDEKEKMKGDKILKLLSENGYVLDKEVSMDYWLVSKDIKKNSL